jgi:sec-independent protein translocase protein TatA
MGGLGFPQLIAICTIALLVFGPKKLPDAGKALGQAIRGFKTSLEAKDEPQADAKAIQAHASCPGCGKPVEGDAAFCIHCGRALAGAQQSRAA